MRSFEAKLPSDLAMSSVAIMFSTTNLVSTRSRVLPTIIMRSIISFERVMKY